MHRILVVEDHPDFREDFERMIRVTSRDCEVIIAVNEQEACQRLRAGRFSVVVTDIDLSLTGGSRTGGLLVLEEVKGHAPESEVIVVTSGDPRHSPERVMDLGGVFVDRVGEHYQEVFMGVFAGALRRHAATQAHRPPELMLHIPDQPHERLRYQILPDDPLERSVHAPLNLETSLLKAVSAAVGALTASEFRHEQDILAGWIGDHIWSKTFGEHTDLARALGQAESVAAERNVAIRIVSGPADLDVPFELIRDRDKYLALQHPLIRTIQPAPNAAPRGTLPEEISGWRVLLIAADTWSDDLPCIPGVDDEVREVSEVFERHNVKPTVLRSWDATRSRIETELKQPWHIVHFAGHSVHDPDEPANSRLQLWDRSCTESQWNDIQAQRASVSQFRGPVAAITTHRLRQCLPSSPPWLMYLSCCHSAQAAGATQAVYSKSLGLVDALIQSGVQVAAGHRWPVLDDEASVKFVTTFYESLLEIRNPKQAILRARQSAQAHEAHWASAVMVLQT